MIAAVSARDYRDDVTALEKKITAVEKELGNCLVLLLNYGISADSSTTKDALLGLCTEKAKEYDQEIQDVGAVLSSRVLFSR